MSNRLSAGLVIVLFATGLTACSDKNDSISINATIDDSSNGTSTDDVAIERKEGNLSVKIPGISANVNLPGGLLAKSDFDIDGVKLYPGAAVTSMKVDAKSGDAQSSVVRIAYAAPGGAAEVRDWYVKAFAEKAIAIVRKGDGLTGKTSDGDTVTMTFAAAAGGKSTGTIDIVDPN